jgi:hypothetical protein
MYVYGFHLQNQPPQPDNAINMDLSEKAEQLPMSDSSLQGDIPDGPRPEL